MEYGEVQEPQGHALRNEIRFAVPRYTVPQAATLLKVPTGTFSKWVYGYRFAPSGRTRVVEGRPIITAPPSRPGSGHRRLSFGGLTEGLVIQALKQEGLRLPAIRRIVKVLRNQIDGDWSLVSKRLRLAGADVLWNHAEQYDDVEAAELTVLESGQRVFTGVVKDYLERIKFDDDDDEYATRLFLPITDQHIVQVSPYLNFGEPTFAAGGAPVAPLLARLLAGDDEVALAQDFGVPVEHITAVAASRLVEVAAA